MTRLIPCPVPMAAGIRPQEERGKPWQAGQSRSDSGSQEGKWLTRTAVDESADSGVARAQPCMSLGAWRQVAEPFCISVAPSAKRGWPYPSLTRPWV